jgi:hypothetical protein
MKTKFVSVVKRPSLTKSQPQNFFSLDLLTLFAVVETFCKLEIFLAKQQTWLIFIEWSSLQVTKFMLK